MKQDIREMTRTPIGAIVIALGIIILGIIAFQIADLRADQGRDEKLAETQEIAIRISERADCRSQISGLLDQVRDARGNINLKRQLLESQAALARVRGEEVETPEVIGAYDKIVRQLERAIQAVDELPTVAEVAEKGWEPTPAVRDTVPGLPVYIYQCISAEVPQGIKGK